MVIRGARLFWLVEVFHELHAPDIGDTNLEHQIEKAQQAPRC